jgi:hypothetical protein
MSWSVLATRFAVVRDARRRAWWIAVFGSCASAACGGSVGSGASDAAQHDGRAFDAMTENKLGDVNTGDSSIDAPPDIDAIDGSEDGGAPIDADVGDANFGDVSVPFPPPDAAHFDSCVPDPCDAGQACLNHINVRSGRSEWSACEEIAMGCEPDPSCLCIVESYSPWCVNPSCKKQGGEFQVNCDLPAPP